MKHKKLVYLAGPYSHPDKAVRKNREICHSLCAVALKRQGEIDVYAPIPETTALCELGGLTGTDWNSWRGHDLNLLSRCDEIYVMMIDGYKESLGVRGEVKFALQNDIPVKFIDEDAMILIEYTRLEILDLFGVEEVTELND
jgi:hypothetical protein